MNSFVFAYLIACYSIGAVGLAIAAITALARPSPIERAYVSFMFAFSLVVVSMTLGTFMYTQEVSTRSSYAFAALLNISGCALISMTLPTFSEILTPWRWARHFKAGFFVLGSLSWFGATIFWFTDWASAAASALLGILGACVLYVTTLGLLRRGKATEEGLPEAERLRWASLMGKIRWVAIAFAPLFFIIDFFPERFHALNWFLPKSLRAAPLFYAIWNVIYMIATIPVLARPHRGGPERGETAESESAGPRGTVAAADIARLADYGLSPRELEVALLLTEGASYKEIADCLSISLATVKTHAVRAYRKTGAGTKIELQGKLKGFAPPDQPKG